jgi:S-adenosylmethionine synthetase
LTPAGQDPRGVACEAATKTGFVMLLGEITTNAHLNFNDLVRKVVIDIGYDQRQGLERQHLRCAGCHRQTIWRYCQAWIIR